MHRRYSESEASIPRGEERTTPFRQSSIHGPVTEMEEGSSQNTQELEEVFDSSPVEVVMIKLCLYCISGQSSAEQFHNLLAGGSWREK